MNDVKGSKRKLTKYEKRRARRLSLFFALTVVAIILLTIAIVWLLGVILVVTGIRELAEITVSSSFYITGALVSSAIIGIGMAYLAGRLLLGPVNELLNGMMRLSNGDYSARVDIGRMGHFEPFRRISEGFNSMAGELQNTHMLRGDFINNFSHEFKTPIASINGLLDLLKKENLPEEKRREYLAVIEEETDRLLQMSSNVLNLSKVEKELVLKDVELYNLSEQIRSCILLLEKKWERKKLSLSLDFDELQIRANQDMLKHVFMNLIDNAIKFSDVGGELAVKIDDPDGKISVRVENTGVAISDDDKTKIFNKFYQADTSHTKEGNGIGLSIVKHIVELHKGEVFVESENGRTAFTVILPQNAN